MYRLFILEHYITGRKQTIQNQSAKHPNSGIRTPADVTCSSWLSPLPDTALDLTKVVTVDHFFLIDYISYASYNYYCDVRQVNRAERSC